MSAPGVAEAAEPAKGRLGWILPASALLHVVAIAITPSAVKHVGPALPPALVELAVVPAVVPPPPPPEVPPETRPHEERPREETPRPIAAATPRATSPASPTRSQEAPQTESAPVDFTSTVFSNDGPGLAIARPSGPTGKTAAPAAAGSRAPATVTRVEAPVVAATSLAKPPRAPGLDAELEKNYPVEARRSAISGKALLRVRILPDGRVGSVQRVSETFAGFGEACERTVRAGRWEPPIDRDGRAVATDITYVCRFEVKS